MGRTRIDIASPYPPDDCLARIGSTFEGSLSRLGVSPLARPSWERHLIGRVDGDVVFARMCGSVDLALDPATPRYLRLFWGLLPGAWSFNIARFQVRQAEAGSRLLGEMIGTPLWLVLSALAVWAAVLVVAIVLFMGNPQPIPFAVVVVVFLAGLGGRAAYMQAARLDTDETLAVLKNAVQPAPDSGWWEETA